MPLVRPSALVAVLAPVISLACGGSSSAPAPSASPALSAAAPAPAQAVPAHASGPAQAQFGAQTAPSGGTVTGTVVETMNSGGYTYARLAGPEGDKWMAAPEMLTIKVGDRLTGDVSMPMQQFRSRTLNREFDVIYFVSRV
ncbi:hypothetical protein VSR68_42610, partial [Paraburkholderia phymatum]